MTNDKLHLLWRLVDVTVPGRSGPRLDRVSVEIPTGITAILGASGAGKTTLLNLLVGYEKPASGTIMRFDSNVLAPGQWPGGERGKTPPGDSSIGERANIPAGRWPGANCGENSPGDSPGAKTGGGDRLPVFWAPPGQGLWPQLTVREHLASLMTRSTKQNESAEQLLLDFDLQALAAAFPATLSQGERDRLSLARAVASGAQVLVLDEPLVHVQPLAAARYWEPLRVACQNRQTSLVLATHDAEIARREATHVIQLEQGRVVFAGKPQEQPA